MIAINGKKLRDRLQNKVKNELDNIKQYLLDLAKKKERDIQSGFQNIRNLLAKQLHSLGTYVEYVSNLKTAKKSRDNLSEQKKKLEEMITALRRFKHKDNSQFSFQQQMLQTALDKITSDIGEIDKLIEQSEAQVVENKETNVEELDKRINEEREKIVNLTDKLLSETLMSSLTPWKEALEELTKIKKKTDESQKKLAQYKGYQEILDINPVVIKEIDDFQKRYDVRHKIWKNRETFDDSQNKWLAQTNFLDLDANEVVNSVKDYEKECLVLKANFPRDNKDEVLEQLTTEVKKVAAHGNLIMALGNKNMQKRHWEKVFALLAEQDKPANIRQFNFNYLIQKGIDAHYEKIEEISA
mmetsp:Transcript_9244/g.8680  ORF Transcript_9244/g.8680 Transcript_9244/m.8680 type:complete len:356 (-) Transcript_9244:2253-3320(-)